MMKRLLTFVILLISLTLTAQKSHNQIHNRYCRHYPEPEDITRFAYRNDWQSPLVHNYDVTFYHLDIEVSHTSVQVGGTVHIHGKVVAPLLDIFAFELIPALNISQFQFNGISYTEFSRVGDNVLYPVAPLAQGASFVASISYAGTPPTGGFFRGVTNAYSSQWQKSVTWTLSEPFGAKEWFPVKQVLTDKADSVWVFLTSPAGTMAGSQGLLTNTVQLPNNKVRNEWKSKYPIVYYLISFAVSDYQEYNFYAKPSAMQGDSLLIQNFIYNHPNYLPQQKTNIDATVPMMELFSDLFTLYPFHEEKYGHCITQLGGGMEHQTMSTMGSFSFNLIAHELGHMWFGDNVTCATWSDIWINEGFATYSNYLAHEMLNGWNASQSFMLNTQNNVISQAGGSVYIPPAEINPNNIWRIFNGRLSYDKGAAIIHVLRHEINNDSLFFAAMQNFQIQFADSVATGEDFKMVAQQTTGMDFDQFFSQWYYGEGYPRYSIEWYNAGNNLHLSVTQTPSASTPLFKMTMTYRINFTDGTHQLVRLFQDANLKQFVIPVEKQVSGIQVDPENYTFERVLSIIVGQPENNKETYFSLGPNPAKEEVFIYLSESGSDIMTIELTDLSGRVLMKSRSQGSVTSLQLSHLQKGTYLVRISNNGINHHTRKLMKI